uniref:Uncharacterized protein n=1 Tax=Arundo donax TaxID=35708 RepID=A0A0A9CVU6_ARUDO
MHVSWLNSHVCMSQWEPTVESMGWNAFDFHSYFCVPMNGYASVISCPWSMGKCEVSFLDFFLNELAL